MTNTTKSGLGEFICKVLAEVPVSPLLPRANLGEFLETCFDEERSIDDTIVQITDFNQEWIEKRTKYIVWRSSDILGTFHTRQEASEYMVRNFPDASFEDHTIKSIVIVQRISFDAD
jgi:hypothetical protein